MGFHICERSRANYPRSALSLSSSLNMCYLDQVAERVGDIRSYAPLQRLLLSNAVMAHLDAAGYTTVAYPTGYAFTEITTADRYSPRGLSEFEWVLYSALAEPIVRTSVYAPEQDFADRIVRTFDSLGQHRREEPPVFVFAHIVALHPPFVLDEHGNPVDASLPDGRDLTGLKAGYPTDTYRRLYVAQLQFVNDRLIAAVRRILSNSDRPCIIVIQSDHGPDSLLRRGHPEDTNMTERMGILNAYYVPEEIEASLREDISPVNSFRLILNYCLGTDYPLLEDRAYFSTYEHPYVLMDVTGRVAGASE